MIKISTNGEALDLPLNFSMQVEDTNPIFNDRGSQSLPATIPATRRNLRLTDYPTRIDAAQNPNQTQKVCTVTNGAYCRRGAMNFTSASRREGITFNVGFDNSTAYAAWRNKKLPELKRLPVIQFDSLEAVMAEINRIYQGVNPKTEPLAVFPILVNNTSKDGEDSDTVAVKPDYWEILNRCTRYTEGGQLDDYRMISRTQIKRLVEDEVTDIEVPDNYGFTPFVRVWKVLELIFADLGVDIINNPFRNSEDLARLVVLNNAADSCCLRDLNYRDLMPDVSVEDFMAALWCRFGLVYNVDFNRGNVRLRLIRDIVEESPSMDLSCMISSEPLVNFEQPKFIKLCASTAIDKTEPLAERFEDFFRCFSLEDLQYDGNCGTVETDDYRITYDLPGCTWSKFDKRNNKTVAVSSSFFNWDPQTEGVDTEEITSEDSWVTVGHVQNGEGDDTFSQFLPFYLVGSRHFHSYVKGSDGKEEEETPLAFMFAYSNTDGSRQTVGRFTPIKLVFKGNQEKPITSLLFQFKGGLFDQYWRKYDEILRHGCRTFEVKLRISPIELYNLDILKPVIFRGVRCLVDSISYSLPCSKMVEAEIKLRTIQTQGVYDICAEQNIPQFDFVDHSLVWELVSNNLQEVFLSQESQTAAIAAWKRSNPDYTPPNPNTWIGIARPISVVEYGQTWQTDPSNGVGTCPWVGAERTKIYKARGTYDIYEVFDVGGDPYADEQDWEPSEVPIGSITIPLTYTVRLHGVDTDNP